MNDRQAMYNELKPLLDGPKIDPRSGRIWSYCPAHGDGKKNGRKSQGLSGRSLSLSMEHGLHCFAGCQFEQIIDSLYARVGKQNPAHQPGGLKERDGRPAALPPRPKQHQHEPAKPKTANPDRRMVEEYEYRDAVGQLLAVKARFEWPEPESEKGYGKDFRWRLPEHPDYKLGVKERFEGIHEMPLWGAELVAQTPGVRVWLAEGERATLAIRAAGELAVCGGWGASQRSYGDALELLRGRDVYLWPDNDPPGREYMATVKNSLKGIARRVTVVNAPVPPKGDAVEYFAAGGTVEALLAGTLTEPAVEVKNAETVIVRIPQDGMVVRFLFEEMAKTQGALDAELTVTIEGDEERWPYTQRINLLSASAREGLQRELGRQFGGGGKANDGPNWTQIISVAYAMARKAFVSTESAVHVADLPEGDGRPWIVQDIVQEGLPTIIFADGASLKTTLCYSMGLEVALGGRAWLGKECRQGAVLIVDYETDGNEAKLVLKRLMLGLGLDPLTLSAAPIYFWPARGVALADQADAIRRFCDDKEISLLIVDAAGDACGGEPEKAISATTYMNGLARIGRASLTIAHINRGEGEGSTKRPFGCHDEATEVLTKRGWVRHADLTEGDEVAAYDTTMRELRWEVPSVRHRYRYDGEMVRIRGASLDLLVTPNHRMWVRPSYEDAYRETTAGALNGTTVALPYASGLTEVNEPDADSDFLNYLGWWLSEGHLDGNAPLLTQRVGPLALRFKETTEALGFHSSIVRPKPRDRERQCWQVRALQAGGFGRWLAEECGRGAANKRIPEVIWQCNRASMRQLLFALMEGDGHWVREGTETYTTISRRLADDVQRLAILSGFSAVVRADGRARSHHNDHYSVLIGSRREIEVRQARHLSREEYHGNVYCLTVPSGAYVTRRNGYMAVTMNSTFWHNRARRTFYVNRDTEDLRASVVDVAMVCRKVNGGAYPEPVAVRVVFKGTGGPILIGASDFSTSMAFQAERPVGDRVEEILIERGPMPVGEIADVLGISEANTRKSLQRGQGTRFRISAGGRGSKFTTWEVIQE